MFRFFFYVVLFGSFLFGAAFVCSFWGDFLLQWFVVCFCFFFFGFYFISFLVFREIWVSRLNSKRIFLQFPYTNDFDKEKKVEWKTCTQAEQHSSTCVYIENEIWIINFGQKDLPWQKKATWHSKWRKQPFYSIALNVCVYTSECESRKEKKWGNKQQKKM